MNPIVSFNSNAASIETYEDLKKKRKYSIPLIVTLDFSNCTRIDSTLTNEESEVDSFIPKILNSTEARGADYIKHSANSITLSSQSSILMVDPANSALESIILNYHEIMHEYPKLHSATLAPVFEITGELEITNMDKVFFKMSTSKPYSGNYTAGSIFECPYSSITVNSIE